MKYKEGICNGEGSKLVLGYKYMVYIGPSTPPNPFIRLNGRTEIYLEIWGKGGFENYSSSHKATNGAVNVNPR